MLEKIKDKIAIHEGSLIGCLYKQPELLSEYDIQKDKLSEDGLFYLTLAERMYTQGNEVFNEISIYGSIGENKDLMEWFNVRGGWATLKEMMSAVSVKNMDAYYDNFNKWHYIKFLYEKGFNVEKEFNKLEEMTSEQVYDYYEYILNSSNISTISGLEFEGLDFTDDDLDELEKGLNVGLQYGKASPILNYSTMGLPKRELSMVGSFINEGKSSFTFENIVIPIANNGHKCLVISNEQSAISFKYLLQVHVLTTIFDYWKLTRKKIKAGKYTSEDKEMLNKARKYIKETYTDTGLITFLKVYDYSMNVVTKAIKRHAKMGGELVLYDVLKAEDSNESTVGQLIESSKEIFQLCSKLNLAGLCTMQLRMELKNKIRFLDLGCLANAKHATECMSEVIFFRELWDDEIDTESKSYCKPFKYMIDRSTGKRTGVREEVTLNTNKKYSVMTLCKSRNDETNLCVLYEKDLAWNKWNEVGYCVIGSKNRF